MLTTVARLQPISLDEILGYAELQTRMDRKYILDAADVDGVIGRLDPAPLLLTIGDRFDFRYETTYFDTPALDSFHSGVFGRRRRFKVRTRTYLDSDECLLEVKTVGGRGHTVKVRVPYPVQARDSLSAAAVRFLEEQGLPAETVQQLRPTMTTEYRRTTLADRSGARVTLDTGLRCYSERGIAGVGNRVLVETKSPGSATPFDRLLWADGHRPVSVSKYGTGMAAIDPALPSNKWHRTLARYFVRVPDLALS